MEISAGAMSAGAAVSGVVVVIAGALIRGAFAGRDVQISGLKATAKILFEKHDGVNKDLQDYKLHVAETYVNREVLREQLLPINKSLDEIKDDMRDLKR